MSDIQEQLKKEITKEKVVIFMKGTPQAPQCGFSYSTCEIFNQLKVPYHTVDVLADQQVREGIKQLTNWPTIPQVFVNGKFIGGCDITRELFESGELVKLLEQK